MTKRLSLVSVSLLILLSGCDPYPCYYHDAFGCYGYAKSTAVTKKSKKIRAKSYNGIWSANLNYEDGSCPYNGAAIVGDLNIRQSNSSVIVSLARYGSFRGRKTSNGFQVNGTYTPKGALCSGKAQVSYTATSSRAGTVRANVDVYCLGRYACSSSFSGTASRN